MERTELKEGTLVDHAKNNITIIGDFSYDAQNKYNSEVFTREFSTRNSERLIKLSSGCNFSTIVFLGLGGIGSWAALFFARLKTTKRMILFEPDCISISNLNRTPFGIDDIDDLKVNVISQMITKINPTIEIHPFNKYFDENIVKEINKVNEMSEDGIGPELFYLHHRNSLVVDCRDNYYNDYHLLNEFMYYHDYELTILRSAYNGQSITIDFQPKNHMVMGRAGYDAQPSHILPAALAALLVVVSCLNYSSYKNGDSRLRYLFETPLTFDSTRTIEYLFNGMMLYRLACSNDPDARNVLNKLSENNYYAFAEEASELPKEVSEQEIKKPLISDDGDIVQINVFTKEKDQEIKQI